MTEILAAYTDVPPAEIDPSVAHLFLEDSLTPYCPFRTPRAIMAIVQSRHGSRQKPAPAPAPASDSEEERPEPPTTVFEPPPPAPAPPPPPPPPPPPKKKPATWKDLSRPAAPDLAVPGWEAPKPKAHAFRDLLQIAESEHEAPPPAPPAAAPAPAAPKRKMEIKIVPRKMPIDVSQIALPEADAGAERPEVIFGGGAPPNAARSADKPGVAFAPANFAVPEDRKSRLVISYGRPPPVQKPAGRPAFTESFE
jgi:hypothetical protein